MFTSSGRLQLRYGSSIAPLNAPTSRPSRPHREHGWWGQGIDLVENKASVATGSMFRTGTSILLRKESREAIPIRARPDGCPRDRFHVDYGYAGSQPQGTPVRYD